MTPSSTVCGLFDIDMLRTAESVSIAATNNPASGTGAGVADTTQDNLSRTVLLLHTSGTSGNKKLVPYTMEMIVTGVACIVTSWGLTTEDVCLNMMPLFHIGGIVRNIFSPVLSGGAVVCCGGFDPFLFWDVLTAQRVTWYYAAPTMHHAILQEAAKRKGNSSFDNAVESVRFIANAAGALPPSLATALQDTFHAVILTSYGMTECMPISTPPQSYRLEPHGTSGIATGPKV